MKPRSSAHTRTNHASNHGMEARLKQLRKQSVQSGTLSVATQVASGLLKLASTVILARLLDPTDFGLIGMVLAVTAFATIFRDLGLSTAALQATHLSAPQQSTLFWINAIVGTGLTLLVAGMAPAIAHLYQQPALVGPTLLMSTMFAIAGLGSQHSAHMQKRMRFGPRMVAILSGSLASLVVAVVMAMAGQRYWSLAWSVVAGSAVTTLLFILLSNFKLTRPAPVTDVRPLLRFGGHVAGFEFVNYLHRNLDKILVGRFAGAETLGLYGRAYQLATLPISLLRQPIVAVALPTLSRLGDQPEATKSYFIRVTSVLGFVTLPVMALIGVAAEPLIVVALGETWREAVPLLQLLAIAGFIQPVVSLRGTLLLALGRSREYMRWGFWNALTMSAAFVVGIRWGAIGVATAYTATTYLLLWPSLALAFRGTHIRMADFFLAIRMPFIASLAGVALSYQFQRWMTPSTPLRLLIAACVAFTCGAFLVYMISSKGRAEMRYKLSLLRELTKRESVQE